MGSGGYVAYTGAVAAQRDVEVIANNIANVSTSGFLRDQTMFDTIVGARLNFARATESKLDSTPGAQQLSGSPLHAAINGPGFFAVEGPDGETFYTRRGDFRTNDRGELVMPSGMRVMGAGGSLEVASGANAQLEPGGNLIANGASVGRLRVVTFDDPSQLIKVGGSVMRAAPGVEPTEANRVQIAVGYVETSNVNLASEMVSLISASRAFEAALRSMTIQDELTETLIRAQQ